MKRTYLAKRNALLSSANVSWGSLALACATLIFLFRLVAPNFFWVAFSPAFRVADAIAERNHTFLNSFSDTASLAANNERLANENQALANENQALLEKMASVNALIGSVPQKLTASGILAGVMARPPESPYDTLVLAAGSSDGVTVGQEAFGAGGVPLGVVSSVLAGFSRVTLFSAPGMMVNGWVGQKNLPITIKGAGAGAMQASVARSAGITLGDIVFAPGPGMLPIGSVARVDSDPSSPSVILRIAPVVNLFSTAWVTLRDTGTALRSVLSSTTPILP
ncbi:MAG: rod shape-determining protein MreC [bacterium]|nr:rod shape-determining protein MreC [bacterium]